MAGTWSALRTYETPAGPQTRTAATAGYALNAPMPEARHPSPTSNGRQRENSNSTRLTTATPRFQTPVHSPASGP